MKKLKVMLLLTLSSALLFTGCGAKSNAGNDTVKDDTPNIVVEEPAINDVNSETEITPEVVEEDSKEGFVRSDLTNEWIDESLADVRPLAIMVPNNKSALPQYNISNAGVVYECLAEGKISRLLCIFDDWTNMDRIGNVRSARAYYVYWALEWDPIFFHYGNVLYADPILNADACDNVNGTKAPAGCYFRVTNEGRISEQTAYTNTEDIEFAIDYYNYSKTHTQYYTPDHWKFANASTPEDLSGYSDAKDCTYIDCSKAYPDNKPYFKYNEEDGLYYRYEFGTEHMDAATNTQLAFKNVLIQYCGYTVLDEYDHLEYQINSSVYDGYYITNGKAVHVTWKKAGDLAATKFYDDNGNEISLNTGKTMVCVVGNDTTVTLQ